LAVLLPLPHLPLILVSLVPYATWTTETLPPVLSLVNYGRVFREPERLEPLLNSVWMAAVSTAVAVGIALVAGWLVVRRRVVWRGGGGLRGRGAGGHPGAGVGVAPPAAGLGRSPPTAARGAG